MHWKRARYSSIGRSPHSSSKRAVPFFEHNRALVRELRELEHKARRRDVLVDEHTIYRVLRGLIPAGIYNRSGFERWRKQAEESKPKLLYLTREYLMRHAAAEIAESLFPDTLHAGGTEFRLRYRFEPEIRSTASRRRSRYICSTPWTKRISTGSFQGWCARK